MWNSLILPRRPMDGGFPLTVNAWISVAQSASVSGAMQRKCSDGAHCMNAMSACPSEMGAGPVAGVGGVGDVSEMPHHTASDVMSTIVARSAADGSAAIL